VNQDKNKTRDQTN